MANTIQDFKSTLKGGGARPNLFEVVLTDIPGGGGFDKSIFSILCKAAQLPASNIASIDVPFRGRIFKVAGDRTFDTWTVTVINDEDFKIRRAMEAWMQFIGQYGDASGSTNPADYMKEATVKQLTRNASSTGAVAFGGGLSVVTTAQYKFYDIFPTNISAIDLSYDTADTIEEFTVEFQVQYWTPVTGEN
jgi:hypothetical protein